MSVARALNFNVARERIAKTHPALISSRFAVLKRVLLETNQPKTDRKRLFRMEVLRFCLNSGAALSWRSQRREISLAVLVIHLFEKSGSFKLVDETRFDKPFRTGVAGKFRTCAR